MTQLALYEHGPDASAKENWYERRVAGRPRRTERTETRMCAACQAREARYGFRDRQDDDPTVERPNTLCFDCFRMEMDRRRAVAEQLARGWNAKQTELPLAGTLEQLTRRRRRAQIAARHALGA
jgi:hypothetical protein